MSIKYIVREIGSNGHTVSWWTYSNDLKDKLSEVDHNVIRECICGFTPVHDYREICISESNFQYDAMYTHPKFDGHFVISPIEKLVPSNRNNTTIKGLFDITSEDEDFYGAVSSDHKYAECARIIAEQGLGKSDYAEHITWWKTPLGDVKFGLKDEALLSDEEYRGAVESIVQSWIVKQIQYL